ncbi:hypothetical protein D9M68_826310 [compost metagenome]
MGEVELAVDQLVAHTGPAGFLAGDDLDAVLLVEAQHRSHHHAGAVGQGNEADLDLFFFRRVGAGGPDAAVAQGGEEGGGGRTLLDEVAARGLCRCLGHGRHGGCGAACGHVQLLAD